MPSSSTKTKRKNTNKIASNNLKSKSGDSLSSDSNNTTSIATTKNSSSPSNKSGLSKLKNKKIHRNRTSSTFEKEEMSKFVLWRRPFQTFYYFILELFDISIYYFLKFLNHRKLVAFSITIILLVTSGFYVEGSHLTLLLYLRKKFLWCCYWVGLGVASSIGLGTGLHTFLLYLGPFIAQVTLAAYECNSLKFPEPPYPDNIICPLYNNNENIKLNTSETNPNGSLNTNNQENGLFSSTAAMAIASSISILSIMSKVRLESFMWGAGTAIGELPPYFMARASALSSIESRKVDNGLVSSEQDEELIEFEELLEAEKTGQKNLNILDKVRLNVFKLIKKVGFWGILLCASIPNPLFDLAGITCGHFLVKFWTFFGATLIGKAIIKMHIQKMFVIFIFSQHHLDNLFELISKTPYIGHNLQPIFQEWLDNEKQKLHRDKNIDSSQFSGSTHQSESILSWLLNKIVLLMVLFFVISIINSLAQRRYKRLISKNSNNILFNSNKVAND